MFVLCAPRAWRSGVRRCVLENVYGHFHAPAPASAVISQHTCVCALPWSGDARNSLVSPAIPIVLPTARQWILDIPALDEAGSRRVPGRRKKAPADGAARNPANTDLAHYAFAPALPLAPP
jgi:hypothetical protein